MIVMDTKIAPNVFHPTQQYTSSTPAKSTIITETNMTSTTEIICYIPWLYAVMVTAPKIKNIADSLGDKNKDAMFLSFLYITFASFHCSRIANSTSPAALSAAARDSSPTTIP
ncbi:hypothetical protein CLAFUW4_12829 [Fulvia fulva]|uniref:Uncharacterized protein n=1 Tax=Passalora fulva TaxID=5499 RepID=A0A9Q8UV38_PASFU|nr:uncharacterized protein CLAFUR5_12695 [Fulvia fulva]KAK4612342.1 hypothetical protein CLAFUR4_12833 [Fulvia fulva]KAK4612848.1 hypothetical protein CLAFUR0_12839 [Fulvia fulva]UJO23442.1 hypothetical protein CLAFUR5_12695 [Fulvia fulva]WPV21251.1 hypothetical protein CLAFUW4_12829 [Fulvia fulva]WPV36394.1 hypothetical protein CLAFUW7_12837 [Fulvia fulva]